MIDDITLVAESEEELKILLMRVKEERGKSGLKLNIQKTKIMASDPIISWQIERGKVEAVTDFIFLGSKITTDSDCSHEIKTLLLLGRKATNLDSILKSKDTFWLGHLFFWNWAAYVACIFLRLVVSQLLHLLLFSWAQELLWMVTAAMKLKDTCFLQEKPSET